MWRVYSTKWCSIQPTKAPEHAECSILSLILQPNLHDSTFKYSKTDPFGKGHVVTLHVTNTLTCPVRAMKQYLETRTFDLYGPLFLFADGSALTCCQFIRYLRSLLEKVGLQAELYAGHSFRIGAATTAAAAGLPDWLLARQDHLIIKARNSKLSNLHMLA